MAVPDIRRQVRTPNIDVLALEGVRFSAAYTQSPVCMPARCSLASGLYPHNHGFWMNFTGRLFPAEQITMFRDIRNAGYSTAKIGKYHFHSLEWGEDYKDYKDYYDGMGLDWAEELPTPYMGPFLKNEYTEHLKIKGLLDGYIRDIARRFEKGDTDVVAPSPLPPDDHPDGYVAGKAVEYIKNCPTDKPMFLCVSFPGPHSPFDAPGDYATMFDPGDIELLPNVPEKIRRHDQEHLRKIQANYFGKIAHLDDRVGQLVDAMKRRGTWDNTQAIFAADHGDYMGSHGRFGKGGFHDESARVPLIMRWPGRIPGGRTTDALAELIDVYPTIIDASGGTVTPHRFGTSLLPVVTDGKDVHDAVFSEIGHGEHFNYMVRTEQYKWFVHGGREALFDMQQDPYELRNLIESESHRDVAAEMKARLRDFLMQTQVNFAADYKNLFTRIGLLAPTPGGMAERLEEMFRQVHSANGTVKNKMKECGLGSNGNKW